MKYNWRLSVTLLALLLVMAGFGAIADASRSKPRFSAVPEASGDLYEEIDGKMVCREATPGEAQIMAQSDPEVRLRPISRIRPNQTGLKITLRGTQQLENFPLAKAAFLKAAASWEAVIQTPVNLVIDVDFGPNRFGMPFPSSVLGSTLNQVVIGDTQDYIELRDKLIAGASSQEEAALYNSLPTTGIQTDLGSTDLIISPTSVLRAIGLISATADPEAELNDFGPPPQIAFNSNFDFDFDPTNGIDVNKFDFDGVATHEIGHALGFFSATGRKEVIPSFPISLSLYDLFRFRPGITLDTFGTATRILTSGGNQVFFSGGSELGLSTGRPDGTGGDGRQSSHWKDNSFTGRNIGIMDPTIGRGERETIDKNDLIALDAFGYRVVTPPEPDFALAFDPAQMSVSRGQSGRFIVNITRTGGFTGEVTVTAPDTKPLKIKLTQTTQTTSGASAGFDFKVKKKASRSTEQLTFSGRDSSGRARTATLVLVIE
jgi:hypothetical protein